MSNDSQAETDCNNVCSKPLLIAWIVGCVLALCLIVPVELERFDKLEAVDVPWLFAMDIDTTPFAILFVALPAFWFAPQIESGRLWRACCAWLGDSAADSSRKSGATGRCWLLAIIVGLVALFNCWRVSSSVVHPDIAETFGDLPPALHDEYSYEFQARTLLDGKLSYASHPTAARLFDQYHVVNEGRFASRYFPGTGAWLAPFVAIGHAHWAQWLATVLTCMFVFGIGRELSCNGVGLLAGLLAACSPGMMLFGNLLLAHQPTLVGLGLFLFCFFRLMRILQVETISNRAVAINAGMAGCGLAFAMLCRPMSAAGVGFPFGVWIAFWLLKNLRQHRASGVRIIGGFGVPLLLGFAMLLTHNFSTTGNAFETPYQLYTDIYTPRHAYGFDNVVNAKPIAPDRVLENYDQWAENLDAARALNNVRERFKASTQWTVGIVPVLISACVFLIGACSVLDRRWTLVLAGVVSLHVAHIPYWYDGIQHWHYVFESGILLCLIVAAASLLLVKLARELGRPWLQAWWAGVLLVSVLVNLINVDPFWGSRLTEGVGEFGFAKFKHHVVEQIVKQNVTGPAIILVKHDPADRHNDYVNNDPALESDILFARYPAATMSEKETEDLARSAYPDRRLFLFDAATNQLRALE